MNQQPPPNYPPPSGPYGYTGMPTPQPRKSRTGLVIAIAAGVVVMLTLCVAFAIANPSAPTAPAATSSQDDTNKRAASATSPATAPSSAPAAAAPTKTTPDAVRVGEGTYTAGEDIPPGRYKTGERAGETCYWEVNTGESIVANNLGGGFPTFTVKKGQQVQIARCPEFLLQGK